MKHPYLFVDDQPLGSQNYYRLKQVDFDGKITYSETKVVKFGTEQVYILGTPNPTVNEVL